MKLKKIEYNQMPQDVYNMEVDDVHCYLTSESGFVLHNCDALRYGIMKLQAKNKVEGAARKVGW